MKDGLFPNDTDEVVTVLFTGVVEELDTDDAVLPKALIPL